MEPSSPFFRALSPPPAETYPLFQVTKCHFFSLRIQSPPLACFGTFQFQVRRVSFSPPKNRPLALLPSQRKAKKASISFHNPHSHSLNPLLEPSQPKHVPHIPRKPQTIQNGQKVEERLIVRIREPPVDGDSVGCGRVKEEEDEAKREGSVKFNEKVNVTRRDERRERTLVIGVRDGRVVDQADRFEIFLKAGKILDIGSVLVLNAGLSK